jgi:hypothetical protein
VPSLARCWPAEEPDFAIITSSTLEPMRKSKPLTADALAELGADRLASLLLDAAEHDATVARRLRIAVAARGGADSAAAATDAEIRRLKRGTIPVDYKRMPALARDLSALGAAIEGLLADADPGIGARTRGRFHRSGASTDRAQRRQRWVHRDTSVRRARRPPCWRLGLPCATHRTRRFPRVPNLFLRRNGVADGIIAAFAQALDAPTRTALYLWIEIDLARLPPPTDRDSGTGRLSAWKLNQALADVADAAGDFDA